jgi:hypothetical protein
MRATIIVSITKDGTANVKDLLVDKIPLAEWVKNK